MVSVRQPRRQTKTTTLWIKWPYRVLCIRCKTALSGIAPVEPQRNSDTVWLCNGFIGNRPFLCASALSRTFPALRLSFLRFAGRARRLWFCCADLYPAALFLSFFLPHPPSPSCSSLGGRYLPVRAELLYLRVPRGLEPFYYSSPIPP